MTSNYVFALEDAFNSLTEFPSNRTSELVNMYLDDALAEIGVSIKADGNNAIISFGEDGSNAVITQDELLSLVKVIGSIVKQATN